MVKGYCNRFLLFISIVCCSTSYGQREAGLETDSFFYSTSPWKVLSIDTSLSSIYNFDFASAFHSPKVDLGNTGSPLQSLRMQVQPTMKNLSWSSVAHGLAAYKMLGFNCGTTQKSRSHRLPMRLVLSVKMYSVHNTVNGLI